MTGAGRLGRRGVASARAAAWAAGLVALSLSYSAVAALVPGGTPGRLLLRTAVWAALVVSGHAGWCRYAGHRVTAVWTPPHARWMLPLAALTAAATGLAIAEPPAGRGHLDLVRITLVGVVAEEALFRGLIWDLLQRSGRPLQRWPDRATLAVTTILFALAHVQYDGFRLSAGLAGQIAYALVAGAGLGWLRGRTGSLVPSVLLHALGNAALKLAAVR